jgi:hypothetical protein
MISLLLTRILTTFFLHDPLLIDHCLGCLLTLSFSHLPMYVMYIVYFAYLLVVVCGIIIIVVS